MWSPYESSNRAECGIKGLWRHSLWSAPPLTLTSEKREMEKGERWGEDKPATFRRHKLHYPLYRKHGPTYMLDLIKHLLNNNMKRSLKMYFLMTKSLIHLSNNLNQKVTNGLRTIVFQKHSSLFFSDAVEFTRTFFVNDELLPAVKFSPPGTVGQRTHILVIVAQRRHMSWFQ